MTTAVYVPHGADVRVAAEVIGSYLYASTYQPQYTWLDAEPDDLVHGTAVIDRFGFMWTYTLDDDDDELSWVRAVYDLHMANPDTGRRTMTGSPIGATWDDDVYWDGPLRYATRGDVPDGEMVHKFRYWPGGYKNGTPVGPYVILSHPSQADNLRP